MLFSSSFLIILLVSLIVFVIGIIRYSPWLFGTLWMHLSGITHHDMQKNKTRLVLMYLISFLIGFIKTYVLAHFVLFLAETRSMALQTGFWLRFGFVITTQLSEILWSNHPRFGLVVLNSAYQLLTMLISVVLLWQWL